MQLILRKKRKDRSRNSGNFLFSREPAVETPRLPNPSPIQPSTCSPGDVGRAHGSGCFCERLRNDLLNQKKGVFCGVFHLPSFMPSVSRLLCVRRRARVAAVLLCFQVGILCRNSICRGYRHRLYLVELPPKAAPRVPWPRFRWLDAEFGWPVEGSKNVMAKTALRQPL